MRLCLCGSERHVSARPQSRGRARTRARRAGPEDRHRLTAGRMHLDDALARVHADRSAGATAGFSGAHGQPDDFSPARTAASLRAPMSRPAPRANIRAPPTSTISKRSFRAPARRTSSSSAGIARSAYLPAGPAAFADRAERRGRGRRRVRSGRPWPARCTSRAQWPPARRPHERKRTSHPYGPTVTATPRRQPARAGRADRRRGRTQAAA